jgi:predicted nucleic acid-binding protein
VAAAEAHTFDIRSFDPRGDDAFLVDTNAWYWITYSRATLPCLPPPLTKQIEQYARFIKKALEVGSTIARCELTFAELAHRIEATEKKIYEYHSLNQGHINLKEYRALPAERERVVSELVSAWSQVTKMSESCVLTVGDEATKGALEAFENYPIGGYDLFHLQAMKQKGLAGILTDDADFSKIPQISVYTCNESILRKAKKDGRLVQ